MKKSLSRRGFITAAAVSVVPPALAIAQGRKMGMTAMLEAAPQAATTQKSAQSDWRDAGVIDVSNSPYAKLKTVPVRAVVIQEGFWSKRRKTNLIASIPSMHDELLEHGRMDNFLRLEGKSTQPQKGPVYSDSDIYKWTEAVGFQLQTGDQPELRRTTDAMLRDVVAIQEPSGYLNTYYNDDRKPLRMQYDTQTTGTSFTALATCCRGRLPITEPPEIERCWMPAYDLWMISDSQLWSRRKSKSDCLRAP